MLRHSIPLVVLGIGFAVFLMFGAVLLEVLRQWQIPGPPSFRRMVKSVIVTVVVAVIAFPLSLILFVH